ncbi:GTP cyclohydrolase II [Monascus purpureus]|uniref:GTP cyclohydrolase II n=1 Tax=Monascus purpureus TaxID=5098 RepID=A0A507QYC1_MONPU|nr:GTP cyclohydrolase II [Monascus purpureus]
MPDLTSHASPSHASPPGRAASDIPASSNPTAIPLPQTEAETAQGGANQDSDPANNKGVASPGLLDSFLSPVFTPPMTPGGSLNPTGLLQQSQLSGVQHTTAPTKLLSQLPNVECIVRARIPTTNGAEMFLHLYHNDIDNKEHLAIVFGNSIRSRSLDRVRPGEGEMDRMIRGAYVGKLRPGRVSSWYDEDHAEASERGKQGDDAGHDTGSSGETKNKKLAQSPLVRIHSECYTGETAWSARCDCGEQLDEAARLMSSPHETLSETISAEDAAAFDANSPGGVIIYLRQEGRGIGLGEKLKAYNLQDLGSDTVEANLLLRHPADARSYGLATAMLVDLGLGADSNPDGIRLLTNNPDKVRAVEGPNREVVVQERVPMIPLAWRTGGKKGIKSSEVENYLKTKISKMGHMIQ